MLEDFKTFLASQKIKVDEAAFAKDTDFIRAMIHYEIDMALFGLSEARRSLLAIDPQAQFALKLFPEAERLRLTAERQGEQDRKSLAVWALSGACHKSLQLLD